MLYSTAFSNRCESNVHRASALRLIHVILVESLAMNRGPSSPLFNAFSVNLIFTHHYSHNGLHLDRLAESQFSNTLTLPPVADYCCALRMMSES